MTPKDLDRTVVILFICLGIAAGHMVWLTNDGSAGEVVSGFGAALILVGLAAIGLPMLRKGSINRAAAQVMPQDRRLFLMPEDPVYDAALKTAEVEIRSSVITERVTAAVLIAAGTLLNGYGPVIARLLFLQGDHP